jgi:hypothetical protein
MKCSVNGIARLGVRKLKAEHVVRDDTVASGQQGNAGGSQIT